MKSKTKYDVSLSELQAIFEKSDLGKVSDFRPLGAGMYNAVFKVKTDGKDYVIKIAPPTGTRIMTYEKDLITTEVLWYKTMSEKTTINTPKIYFLDTSRQIIPCDYFIMDYVEGKTVDKIKKSAEEEKTIRESLCKGLASLHKIKSDKFGYVQNEMYDNWYDALKSFVINCLNDLKTCGKKSRRGEKLLEYVNRHAEMLKTVKGCLINYDLWDLNVIATRTKNGIDLTWIDPERGFYGDFIFDFICVDIFKMSLADKKSSIAVYNSFTPEKLVIDKNAEVRFAFALGYMALIQETEKYYRYRPINYGWWLDVFSSKLYYGKCFKLLKANS